MRLLMLGLLITVMAAGAGCIPVLAAAGAGATAVVREHTDEAVLYKGNINAVENGVSKAMLDMGARESHIISVDMMIGTMEKRITHL